MPVDPDETTISKVDKLREEGRNIDAIRVLREATGCGLSDAKEWMIARGGHRQLSPETLVKAFALADLEQLLYDGKFIEAIKEYRKAVGCDLKEAKETIDAFEKDLRAENPGRFKFAKRSGCVTMVAIVLMLGAVWMWH